MEKLYKALYHLLRIFSLFFYITILYFKISYKSNLAPIISSFLIKRNGISDLYLFNWIWKKNILHRNPFSTKNY